MVNKPSEPTPGNDDDQTLANDVNQAMASLGWRVPECEEDVRRAEEELTASVTALPASLGDAETVFTGKARAESADVKTPEFSPDVQAEQDLARAARQGAAIPPEIERRMRRDREAAEDALTPDEAESQEPTV